MSTNRRVAFVLSIQVLVLHVVCAEFVGKPAFSRSGEFTIMQVSDGHVCDDSGELQRGSSVCSGVDAEDIKRCSSTNSTDFVRRAIEVARPDLVVFTGDNICADALDPFRAMRIAFAPAIDARVPWTATLGNHDDEGRRNVSRIQLIERLAQWPGFVATEAMAMSPVDWVAADALSAGTFAVHVLPRQRPNIDGSASRGIVLWMLDTGSDSTVRASGADGISDAQMMWIEQTAAQLAMRSGLPPEAKLSSLAFMHQPLAQFGLVKWPFSGSLNEAVSVPAVSAHVLPSIARDGGVKAVFAGHDHLNDFCFQVRTSQRSLLSPYHAMHRLLLPTPCSYHRTHAMFLATLLLGLHATARRHPSVLWWRHRLPRVRAHRHSSTRARDSRL